MEFFCKHCKWYGGLVVRAGNLGPEVVGSNLGEGKLFNLDDWNSSVKRKEYFGAHYFLPKNTGGTRHIVRRKKKWNVSSKCRWLPAHNTIWPKSIRKLKPKLIQYYVFFFQKPELAPGLSSRSRSRPKTSRLRNPAMKLVLVWPSLCTAIFTTLCFYSLIL